MNQYKTEVPTKGYVNNVDYISDTLPDNLLQFRWNLVTHVPEFPPLAAHTNITR